MESMLLIFDNVSIFNLIIDYMSNQDLEIAFQFTVDKELTSIINLFFEELSKDKYKITPNIAYNLLTSVIRNDNCKVFKSLLNQIKTFNEDILKNYFKISSLLRDACQTKNVEAGTRGCGNLSSPHFDSKKSDILSSFVQSYTSNHPIMNGIMSRHITTCNHERTV